MNVVTTALSMSRLVRPISVAPMIDVTNPHFLQMLRIISPRYALYTEMIHSNAIINHREDISRFVGVANEDTVVQLGGCDPGNIALASKIVQDHGFKEVNINVGCPSDRVQHGNFGAVLMKTPHVVANMLNELEKASVQIPVTIKCRTGVDDLDSIEFLHNFIEVQLSSSRPPPHIIIHARKCHLQGLSPRQNRNIPPLDYNRVWHTAKKYPQAAFSINGGFRTTESVIEAISKIDGCMIGREVMDNPMFLQQLDRDVYKIPDVQLQSSASIIDNYLSYVNDFLSAKGHGAHRPSIAIMAKPVMMLYQGGLGRRFRRALGEEMILERKNSKDLAIWNLDRVVYRAMEQVNLNQESDEPKYQRASL
ncbi:dihydrouridine synthase-domain-containing protein [Umbelopsis sp. AD052]|nr:dihydrouridine synthase-domain-containing protein [Umbelopsis sp. AD052]